MFNRGFSGAITTTLLCLAATPACAQSWPTKPIRLIVPFQVVGASGTPARGIGELLGPVLGQPIVVENRAGANGSIGTGLCAKAAPDGYTFCVTNSTTISSNPLMYANLSYDPPRDLAPIIQIGVTHTGVYVHHSVPVNSMRELFDLAKKKPQGIAWATSGRGSGGHLLVEWLNSNGIQFLAVPFKSIDQSMVAIVSGEVQVLTNTVGAMQPLVRAGKVKALAAGIDKRASASPDVPSFSEAGLDARLPLWVGAFAPAGTPGPILRRLNAEIDKLLKDPRYTVPYLEKITMDPVGGSIEEFVAFLRDERARYEKIIKLAGIKPE